MSEACMKHIYTPIIFASTIFFQLSAVIDQQEEFLPLLDTIPDTVKYVLPDPAEHKQKLYKMIEEGRNLILDLIAITKTNEKLLSEYTKMHRENIQLRKTVAELEQKQDHLVAKIDSTESTIRERLNF